MMVAVACVLFAVLAFLLRGTEQKPPLDRDEIRRVRRFADRIRREQALPYD